MALLLSLFRLIRLPNLLIVVLTQWFLYQFVLVANYEIVDLTPVLRGPYFWYLTAVVVLLTSGGYVINDIIDYQTDKINKPQKVIVNKTISEQLAYFLYVGSLILGFLFAELLAYKVDKTHLILIYPLAAGGLYLYSVYFKRQFITGNLVISLYCAGVAGILWIAEQERLVQLKQIAPEKYNYIAFIFMIYSFFAFLSTLIREIIKDAEDIEGDKTINARTLPIVLGISSTKIVVFVLGLFLILAVSYAVYDLRIFDDILKLIFIFLTIICPLLLTVTSVLKAKSKSQFHRLSQVAKLVMVSGVILLLIISL